MFQPVFRHPALAVRGCDYGWGVFATANLAEGTVVERCPYLELPASACTERPLCDYVFCITDDVTDPQFESRAMSLGWGALFNHADRPNLSHSIFTDRRILQFTTSRPVRSGQQLFVSYGTVWWADRAIKPA